MKTWDKAVYSEAYADRRLEEHFVAHGPSFCKPIKSLEQLIKEVEETRRKCNLYVKECRDRWHAKYGGMTSIDED